AFGDGMDLQRAQLRGKLAVFGKAVLGTEQDDQAQGCDGFNALHGASPVVRQTVMVQQPCSRGSPAKVSSGFSRPDNAARCAGSRRTRATCAILHRSAAVARPDESRCGRASGGKIPNQSRDWVTSTCSLNS